LEECQRLLSESQEKNAQLEELIEHLQKQVSHRPTCYGSGGSMAMPRNPTERLTRMRCLHGVDRNWKQRIISICSMSSNKRIVTWRLMSMSYSNRSVMLTVYGRDANDNDSSSNKRSNASPQ